MENEGTGDTGTMIPKLCSAHWGLGFSRLIWRT